MGNTPFHEGKRRVLSPIRRLKRKSITDEKTGCIIWTGSSNGIYGQISYLGMMMTVHRLSAHLHLGLDLKNREAFACHKDICPNKKCWNPDHLYIGSRSDNSKDVWKVKYANT